MNAIHEYRIELERRSSEIVAAAQNHRDTTVFNDERVEAADGDGARANESGALSSSGTFLFAHGSSEKSVVVAKQQTQPTTQINDREDRQFPLIEGSRKLEEQDQEEGTAGDDHILGAVGGPNGTFVFAGRTSADWSGSNAGQYDCLVIKVDDQGDILWAWQNGTVDNDMIKAVALTDDESVVVGGYRDNNGGFLAAKLDTNGTVLWQWNDATGEQDAIHALAMEDDGTTVFAGFTEGSWISANFGGKDFAASKLNVNGTLLWKWQNGTEFDDRLNAAAVGEDGSIVFAGWSEGDWGSVNFGSSDFVAVKLDSNGKELWRWQNGTDDQDEIRAILLGDDGSVVLAGYTHGNWSGLNAGEADFAACKLDADGREVWRWQNGTPSADEFYGVLEGHDESIVFTGFTAGLWSVTSNGLRDMAAISVNANATELWRWQNGTSGSDLGRTGAASVTKTQIVVAGSTTGSLTMENAGGNDVAAFFLDPEQVPAMASPTDSANRPWVTPTPSQAMTPYQNHPGARPEATTAPSTSTDVPFSRETRSPGGVDTDASLKTSTIVAVVCSAFFLVGVCGAGLVYRRRARKRGDPATLNAGHLGHQADETCSTAVARSGGAMFTQPKALPIRNKRWPSPPCLEKRSATEDTGNTLIVNPTNETTNSKRTVGGISLDPAVGHQDEIGNFVDKGSADGHPYSVAPSTKWPAECLPSHDRHVVDDMPDSGERESADIGDDRKPSFAIGVAPAVLGVAQELARMSQMPGVTEVAGLVIVLMNLVMDSSEVVRDADSMVKRCRSVLGLLQRADGVLQQVEPTNDAAHCVLVEDVRDSVADLVPIIKTYQSKGRLSQIMMSTLFKRRQEEAEAVIEAAVARLQFGLQVQMGHELNKLGKDLRGGEIFLPEVSLVSTRGVDVIQRSEFNLAARLMLETRRQRRQRKLEGVEIPESYVTVTDECLGTGGFGSVYIADYNGHNAAAKRFQPMSGNGSSRRKAFLKELHAMIRLRSPHTVNVYGAITSRTDCYILIMELLPGGNLRELLQGSTEPLADEHAHRIIRDICLGMAFLHRKRTIHGDLKSPNILLDWTGRAKVMPLIWRAEGILHRVHFQTDGHYRGTPIETDG
eukprot:jgi/Undpi1/7739/HiC_scaffold_23.g10212.m1